MTTKPSVRYSPDQRSGSVPPATRDWDGATYDRISAPHERWARVTIERLGLEGDETVLDAGCGSGRVTKLLLEQLPDGHVFAVDAAPGMLREAEAALGDRATVWQQDLQQLTVPRPVDAVFSNAVFHHVPDHDALFTHLHAAMKPGGKLVAQCGGEGNVERFQRHAQEVGARERYAEWLGGFDGSGNFAAPEPTREKLAAAGFTEIDTWLEESPVKPPEPETFLHTVCLGPYLNRLPEELREPYTHEVWEACGGDELELDYVRLNIVARA